jgi:hypothetical protein
MEAVQNTISWFITDVWPYWSFIAFFLVVSVVSQTVKSRLLTKQAARKYKVVYWIRRIFPLIIVMAGLVVGLIWSGDAAPGVSTKCAKVWYFMASSGTSIIGFDIIKQWIKKKYDLDLSDSDPNDPS